MEELVYGVFFVWLSWTFRHLIVFHISYFSCNVLFEVDFVWWFRWFASCCLSSLLLCFFFFTGIRELASQSRRRRRRMAATAGSWVEILSSLWGVWCRRKCAGFGSFCLTLRLRTGEMWEWHTSLMLTPMWPWWQTASRSFVRPRLWAGSKFTTSFKLIRRGTPSSKT